MRDLHLQSTDPVAREDLCEVEENDGNQRNRNWRQLVQNAVGTLKLLSKTHQDRSAAGDAPVALTISELFTLDGSRFIVKASARKYFDIFPWFLVYKDHPHRFRETLSQENGELIVEALNFFWNTTFDEHDLRVMTRFCAAPPDKHLSPIQTLRLEIEKNRQNIKLQAKYQTMLDLHEARLTRLEARQIPDQERSPEDQQPLKKQRHLFEVPEVGENLSLDITLHDHHLRLEALEGNEVSFENVPYPYSLTFSDHPAPDDYQSSDFDDDGELSSSTLSHELSDDDLEILKHDLQNIIGDPAPLSPAHPPPPSPRPPLFSNGDEEILNNICSKGTLIVELLTQIIHSSPATSNDDSTSPPLDLASIHTNLNSILFSIQSYHENFHH
jgi:hypothetical protein